MLLNILQYWWKQTEEVITVMVLTDSADIMWLTLDQRYEIVVSKKSESQNCNILMSHLISH